MKWYTAREFFGMWGRSSYNGNNISKYAAELGDGWRAWVTLDAIVLAGIVIGHLFGWPVGVSIFIFVLVLSAPLIMTIGYLMGAIARRFSLGEVLKLAFRHLRA